MSLECAPVIFRLRGKQCVPSHCVCDLHNSSFMDKLIETVVVLAGHTTVSTGVILCSEPTEETN